MAARDSTGGRTRPLIERSCSPIHISYNGPRDAIVAAGIVPAELIPDGTERHPNGHLVRTRDTLYYGAWIRCTLSGRAMVCVRIDIPHVRNSPAFQRFMQRALGGARR